MSISSSTNERLHALDAVRAFALLLGVVFHAGFSFIPGLPPGIWAIVDRSPSTPISALLFTTHIFRMTVFFFIAGFFAHMVFHRRGSRAFWADRGKRILVPLVAAWPVLAPLVAAIWIWGLTKTFGGTLPAAPAGMPPPPRAAFHFMHLWFLYYLVLLYVAVVGLRSAVAWFDREGRLRSGVDRIVGRLVGTCAAMVILPIPVVVGLVTVPVWFAWFGVPTPDQSFIPQPASFAGYGTAVGFGWLAHRQPDLLAAWKRLWPIHLAAAIVTTAVCLSIEGTRPSFVPAASGLGTIAFAASYGIAAWSWTFALVGMALRFMARPNPLVRYVADASYWIYLAHLPLVVALQILVAGLPLHWSVKFPLVLVVAFVILFGSYRYLVRSTFIGQVLNGRRYPRGLVTTPEPAVVASSVAPAPGDDTTRMAALTDVRKAYGATKALTGLDLDVRRGELLAVLGPNGAGKSTALGLLLGLIEPDGGSVELLGGSPRDMEARRCVGVMMQDVGLTPELRVRELIACTASYYPTPMTVAEVLGITRLDGLADRAYAKLSGGQKRQVQFALAICGRPSLLFLDEPTTGLDLDARERVWQTVRSLVAAGCSVVLTTHYLEEAEALADRVAVVTGGRLIASGTVAEVRAVVSRKQITCTSTLDADTVSAWAGVVAAAREGSRLRITVVDAEDVVRQLLQADAAARDLEIRQAGLAEAFTHLTQEAA